MEYTKAKWKVITKRELAKLYKDNSAKQIADLFGFATDETVRKKLVKLKIPRRPSGTRKIVRPSREEIKKVYPEYNLEDAGRHFNVGQTLFFKWLQELGIPTSNKIRGERSEEHKANLSKALKGKAYPERRNGIDKPCDFCKKAIYVPPPRLRAASKHYCDLKCKGKAGALDNFAKICDFCASEFWRRDGETAGNYRNRKYCSAECRTKAAPPPTLLGADNPRYKGELARRKQSRGTQGKWRRDVLSRDQAICQHCGDKDVPLVAHHILSWEDFPHLRDDVDNGLTLCNPCHFIEHGWELSENGIRELVDERGILNRRWSGFCLTCDKFIVKQASDMRRPDGTYRTYGFCCKKCALKASGKARRGIPKREFKGMNVSQIFEAWEQEKKAARSLS